MTGVMSKTDTYGISGGIEDVMGGARTGGI